MAQGRESGAVTTSPQPGFFMGGGGGWGGGRRNNNTGMIGHASAEDTRFLMGSGGVLPRKRFEI